MVQKSRQLADQNSIHRSKSQILLHLSKWKEGQVLRMNQTRLTKRKRNYSLGIRLARDYKAIRSHHSQLPVTITPNQTKKKNHKVKNTSITHKSTNGRHTK